MTPDSGMIWSVTTISLEVVEDMGVPVLPMMWAVGANGRVELPW
ncbi:hypothetical protein ACWDPV_10460 [Gordonia sp. NPDC003504]